MAKSFIKTAYLALLRTIARLEIKKHKDALIIGITGSTGKTSCLDMLTAFLKPHYPHTLKITSKGSYGASILYEILDIPVRYYKSWDYPSILVQALWHLFFSKKVYDVFIVEYGIKGPGQSISMDQLLRVATPDVALLLPISSTHGLFYEHSLDDSIPQAKKVAAVEMQIAKENFKLLQAVKDKKKAFYVPQIKKYIDAELLKGMSEIGTSTAITISRWDNTADGITIGLATPKGDISAFIKDVVLPESATVNVLFAAQVATILKKNLHESMAHVQENYSIAPGRSSIMPGIKGTIVLDSSYNANPYAAKELFAIVKDLARKGRRKKVIVLGDFRELGEATEVVYKEVIKEAAKVADVLVLTNEAMKEYGLPAAENEGFILNENLYWFANGRQLGFHIAEVVEDKSVVLFEGSQNGIFLEYAVAELVENKGKEYIRTHLPRMTQEWLKIKAKQGI